MKKKALRKQFKEQRQTFTPDQIQTYSDRITQHLKAHFTLTGKKISVFLPIEKFNEINTYLIIDAIQADYYLPVTKKNLELEHVLYESQDQIKINDWGIPEPQYGDRIDPFDIDAVLVPLLAIDKKGNRVGYGAGFYDNFLAQTNKNCLLIGIGYFDPVDEIEDLYEGDIPLHAYVTPNSVIHFNERS